MDFFQRQDEARHRTAQLLVYFGLGVLTLVVLVYLLFAFLFLYLGASADRHQTFWDPGLFTVAAGGVLLVVTCGSLFKAAQLASGGKSVALMLDGQEVLGTTSDPKERRLLNVVEEMAIASGVPVPPVYILPEPGINAFAAGHGPGDTVIAVSQGCLAYLTRDELQGVIGHEFSHALNGDVRLNLRIVGLIFGILALSQVGWVLMQVAGSSRSSDDRKGNGGNLFLLGLGLYVLGMGGAFFGWLIQAAVSRQRESLADASAVQFTRNPDGICGALKKIGGLEAGSQIANPHAGEISHMFVADAFMGKRLTGLFDTHPPLEERIRALDPQFDGTYPPVKPVGISAADEPPPPSAPARLPSLLPGVPSGPIPQFPVLALGAASDAATAHVGRVQPHHLGYAAALQSQTPDPLRAAAQSPFSARALIYALLLDQEPGIRQTQLEQLRTGSAPRDYDETLRLAELVRQLPDAARLPLLDRAMPALRQTSPPQCQAFRTQVEALIHADQQVSLFEYALHSMLNRYLDAGDGRRPAVVRYRQPEQVLPQVVMVMSLLAWEGEEQPDAAQAAFAAGIRVFIGVDSSATLLPRDQCSLRQFDAALRSLAQASPDVKRRVVASCWSCIMADQQVTVREGELLRAISATLGCPMPPLVGESV